MDHSSYSREFDRLKRRLDDQHPSESEAVELLCKAADLVRQRTEFLVERSGPFLGYDYSAVGGGDGGLVDRNGCLWALINAGWDRSNWARMSRDQCRVIERTLSDVTDCLATVHPGSALAALAEMVLAARRDEWSEQLARVNAAEGLAAAFNAGLVSARWEVFRPGQPVEDDGPSSRFGDNSAPRGPIQISRAGRHVLSERESTQQLGLPEAAEEFVNWRFCPDEVPGYWLMRNRLLAVSLGLNLDPFCGSVVRRLVEDMPKRYWHAEQVAAAGWFDEGYLEIPMSFPSPEGWWPIGLTRGGGLELFRREMVEYVQHLLERAADFGLGGRTAPPTNLEQLWQLGLTRERPSMPGQELPLDLFDDV